MSDPITSDDLEFLRELVSHTQSGKVSWDEGDGGGFISRRARTTALLDSVQSGKGRPSAYKLSMIKPGKRHPERVLEQQIDEAAPQRLDLEFNSLLAYLYQLVSSRFNAGTGIYEDFFDSPETH